MSRRELRLAEEHVPLGMVDTHPPVWTGAVPRLRGTALGAWGIPIGVAVLAFVVLWISTNPLAGTTNDPDAAASVLYFQRLVSGTRLEAFVPVTPKPLLTVAYGLLWQLTHDWRALTLFTVVVGAAVVGLAAAFARRLAGLAAAVFIATALLIWPDFRVEVAHANSFVVALALWLLSGLFVTAGRPRLTAAGITLLAAGLVRPETVWLLAAAAVGIVVLAILQMAGRDADPRRYLPLLAGVVAIPIICLHDLLLTGQPLYWLHVPDGYTVLRFPTLGPIGLDAFGDSLQSLYGPSLALVILAAIGLVGLVRARQWAAAGGLAFMVAGVVVTLAILGLRGTFVDTRYYEELNAPLLVAAAVGIGAIVGWISHVTRAEQRSAGQLRFIAFGAIGIWSALAVAWPQTAPAVASASLDRWREANADLSGIIATLPPGVETATGSALPVAGVAYPVADPGTCLIYVPRQLFYRIAVETGAGLTALGDSYLAFRDGTSRTLHEGQWVLHIAATDGRGGQYAPFEVAAPTVMRSATGTPLFVNPVVVRTGRDVWLVRA
jgi:hypothetical protein